MEPASQQPPQDAMFEIDTKLINLIQRAQEKSLPRKKLIAELKKIRLLNAQAILSLVEKS